MDDGFVIDTSELNRLSTDLGAVPSIAGRYIRSAVETTARHIRDDWREAADGMAHAPAFPASITYDIASMAHVSLDFSSIRAEIGPDKDRAQGALGNLIEFGSVNNPPWGLGHGALQRYEDDFQRGLQIAAADAENVAGVDASMTRSIGAVFRGSYR